ncbi:uncharacterized protein QC763_501878 [Podospora pseudopauciseta]|uniref:Rhodopsin domain-containing protein n=1 Tax=Podospora pseudopauciseta TaxID=2093780 RepID=A0ABR0H7P6_9PEZI|nr:hypothetical protein QC763_501878 [Podospora pseudopauciseta]
MDTSKMTPEIMALAADFPMAAPPPGVTANLDNPTSDAWQIFVLDGFCTALMLAFTAARIFSTTWLGQRVNRIHELVFYTGFVTSLAAVTITICAMTGKSPYAIQTWNVRLGDFKMIHLVSAHLFQVITPMAQFFVKCSVLLLYYNIFSVLRWMRMATTISIVLLFAFQFSVAIATAVNCSPTTGQDVFSYLMAFSQPRCFKGRLYWLVMGIGSVIVDVGMIILPLPAVWSLRLPLKRKLAVSAMFLVGLFGLISSILTLHYRVIWYHKELNDTYGVPLWSTAIAEITVGVIVSCMPALAVIWRKIRTPPSTKLSSGARATMGKSFGRSFGAMTFTDHRSQLDGDDSYAQVYCPRETTVNTAWPSPELEAVSMQEHGYRPSGPAGAMKGKQSDVWVSQLG